MGGSSRTSIALEEAWAAFSRAEWEMARHYFQEVVDTEPTAEALDGLGQSQLWCGDEEGAIETRTRAFAAYRREGDPGAAAAVGVYLAAEYRIAGNASLANGWLSRAERLLEECETSAGHGWFRVELSKRAADSGSAERHAREAVEIARQIGDAGLESCALSHLALARISQGDVERGLALLDEAMAMATGGEADDPLAIADACCTTLVACERIADQQRAHDWGRVVAAFMRRRHYAPLLSWCRATFAGFLIATGQWREAEEELERSLTEARLADHPSRGVTALAHLAELRVLQGRFEEAERLLAGIEDRPVALAAAVGVHLARGNIDVAGEKVRRRLEAVGEDDAAAAPLLVLRARVELAQPDSAATLATVSALRAAAQAAARHDLVAVADVLAACARGLAGEPSDVGGLEAAVETFSDLSLPLDEGLARLELARALAVGHRSLAIEQARMALALFERLGATRHADEAARALRDLGAPGRPLPRTGARLTRREQQVLGLLGAGLSNAEIAERLVISHRTAEHHVGRILRKLALRNRAEAAAYAVREGIQPLP